MSKSVILGIDFEHRFLIVFWFDFGVILGGFWGSKSVIFGIDFLMIFECRSMCVCMCVRASESVRVCRPGAAPGAPKRPQDTPRSAPRGPQDRPKRSKIDSKIDQKSSCRKMASKTAPRPPKSLPRRPPDLPRTPPNPPKTSPKTLPSASWIVDWAPKTFQNRPKNMSTHYVLTMCGQLLPLGARRVTRSAGSIVENMLKLKFHG